MHAFTILVFYGLDAPATGDIILGGRQFDLGIVADIKGILDEALSVGELADDHATVQVLHDAGDNLGG